MIKNAELYSFILIYDYKIICSLSFLAFSMRAMRLHEYGKPLKLEDVPVPEVRGEEVLIKVGGAGVCHSDVHFVEGHWKEILPTKLPITPGHEVAGWIEDVGDDVVGFKKGDPVAVYAGWGCGVCKYCKSGMQHLCANIVMIGLLGADGGFAEYLHYKTYRNLVKIDGLNPAEAAPLTDAALTSYSAVKKVLSRLHPDGHVVVVGVGGLGQYAIQFLKLLMPTVNVIAVDISDEKLEIAEKLGADYIINSKDKNFIEEIMKITKGYGAEALLDFVGEGGFSTLVLGKKGVAVSVGLGGTTLSMPVFQTVLFEHEVWGSFYGSLSELEEVVELAKTGKIKMPIEKYKLEEANEVLEKLKRGEIKYRAVLVP